MTAEMSVLEVGSGVGGPARFLAETHGCRVMGVDLSESFVDASRCLTERTEQSGRVSFETASALELRFNDGCFDVVLLQHVAMNIDDRVRLYREFRRVLKAVSRFATFDVVSNGGDLHYPLRWARTSTTSLLTTVTATRDSIDLASFRILTSQDDTKSAQAWFAQLRVLDPQPSPNLDLLTTSPSSPPTWAGSHGRPAAHPGAVFEPQSTSDLSSRMEDRL
jgi:sarcosine/dimethylglycine N-methyltransferase